MNKEIKFKVYHKNKLFGYEKLTQNGWEWMCIELNPDNGERWVKGVFNDNTDLDRKQYTNLKDKKGKEIYQGDFLQIDDNDSIDKWMRGEIGEVKFIPARFTLCLKNGNKKMLTEDFEDCVTIIENPNLFIQA